MRTVGAGTEVPQRAFLGQQAKGCNQQHSRVGKCKVTDVRAIRAPGPQLS
jgi:hypothetical protein